MKSKKDNGIYFGNWVPIKMILIPGILGMVFLVLGIRQSPFLIAAGLFAAIAGYFAISDYLFSPAGKDIQAKVQELILKHIKLEFPQQILDIGCGNAPLTIELAKRFPGAQVTGLDLWGKNWDYSMRMCQENAQQAGVTRQVTFRQGSATELPFEDDSFDLVVSNLVFHEVGQAKDKRQPLCEAMRVLKPGGEFVLQDLFLLRPYFGSPEKLKESLQNLGVRKVEFIRTCDSDFIPGWVKLPFMLGTLAVLRGVK